MLGNHFDVGENGHEVRISAPARHDVQMDVIGDARAGRVPEVPAQVEAAGAVHTLEHVYGLDGEPVHVERLFVREVGEAGDVPVGGHHQMARGVRVLVQEDEGRVTTVHEQRLSRVDRARRLVAERTALLLARLRDVLEAPRRPQRLRHTPFLPSVVVIAIALATVCSACGRENSSTGITEATVGRVADGDTIELAGGTRVRLVQIDAPELGEGECYSRDALHELEGLVRKGQRVELESDRHLDDVDRYGRLLRYVLARRMNVNVELVRRGAATPYFVHGVRGSHADELLAGVAAARSAGRGMWGACRVTWREDRRVDARSG
jgi:micrococcal nuclease